ncbi:MAG TPA: hypothetical protein VNX21_06775 [Candidatus Thermoplasmatota archaeon]|nr:hypothetical protein [Candidatus Thermoplasmatota archaeon]
MKTPLLVALLVLAPLPLAPPTATACHPVHDGGDAPVWAGFDHGCGGDPGFCYRALDLRDCVSLP